MPSTRQLGYIPTSTTLRIPTCTAGNKILCDITTHPHWFPAMGSRSCSLHSDVTQESQELRSSKATPSSLPPPSTWCTTEPPKRPASINVCASVAHQHTEQPTQYKHEATLLRLTRCWQQREGQMAGRSGEPTSDSPFVSKCAYCHPERARHRLTSIEIC